MIHFILQCLLILGLTFAFWFVVAVIHDYLVYRSLMRRLREEWKEKGEAG